LLRGGRGRAVRPAPPRALSGGRPMAKKQPAGRPAGKRPDPRRRAAAAAPAVRVRMYRQGLGDCFLLAFAREGGGTFHVLIDCGVVLGTPEPQQVMGRVARDVAAVTGGRLDVVVATHEHWDPLAGFLQARAVFDDVHLGEVWFAWTEDPADDLAARLREGHRRALRALQALAPRLTAANAARVGGLLEFFGAAAAGGTTRDALN